MIRERYSVGTDPALVLEIPYRLTGVLVSNTGTTNVLLDTDPKVRDGFTLRPGSAITLPSSVSPNASTKIYAVADGDGGEVTYYLPEW